MTFYKANVDSLQVIHQIVSGLQVNTGKSSIFFGGVREEDKSELLQVLQFPEGQFSIRYLGIPLSLRRLRISEYDLSFRKVQAWSLKILSYAGRLALLKSVLLSIERL